MTIFQGTEVRPHTERESHIDSCWKSTGQEGARQAINSTIPHPRIPADVIAPMIPHGTAVAALEASSLICTLESNEPEGLMSVRSSIRVEDYQ